MPINLPKMGGKANSSRSVDPATETINKYFDSAIGCSFDYSEATAEWLATIVDGDENKHDLQHLATILRDTTQPLGALTRGFVRLFAELHHADLNTTRDEARLQLRLAATTFRLGASRLVTLILDVLPPLRAAAHLAEAVEATLFEDGVAGTLEPLLRASEDNDRFGARVDALASLSDTVLAERLGLSPSVDPSRLAEAVAIARTMPCLPSPRAKLRAFLDACAAAAESVAGRLGADELIPAASYALAKARHRSLPSDLLLLELFITNEHELLGPLGYGLVTLHAATGLIGTASTSRAAAAAAAPAADNKDADDNKATAAEELRAAILSHPRVRLGPRATAPTAFNPPSAVLLPPSSSPPPPPRPPPASPAVVRTRPPASPNPAPPSPGARGGAITARVDSPGRRHRTQWGFAGAATARTMSPAQTRELMTAREPAQTAREPLAPVTTIHGESPVQLSPQQPTAAGKGSPSTPPRRATSPPTAYSPASYRTPPSTPPSRQLHMGATPPSSSRARRRRQRCSSGGMTNRTMSSPPQAPEARD